jgi:hypothetical protein
MSAWRAVIRSHDASPGTIDDATRAARRIDPNQRDLTAI